MSELRSSYRRNCGTQPDYGIQVPRTDGDPGDGQVIGGGDTKVTTKRAATSTSLICLSYPDMVEDMPGKQRERGRG